MECLSLSLNMRIPPPTFRGLFAPLHPIPSTSLIFSYQPHTYSRSVFLSVKCYRSSSSAAALDIETPKQFSELKGKEPINPCGSLLEIVVDGSRRKTNLGRDTDGDRRNSYGNLAVNWYSENLKNCASNLSLNGGKEIHAKLIKHGLEPDMHLWVSLINLYAKCGDLTNARKVLDEMPERNVVSWTALINGYVAKGFGLDCALLFIEMQREGIRPNEFTFATVLKAVSMYSDLGIGKQVHALLVKAESFLDVYVGSALVDFYSKCGDMEYANKVFFSIPKQNSVSWNALLNGYAEKGNSEEIMKILWEMNKLEIKLSKFNLSTVIKGVANSGDLLAGEILHSVSIKMGCELDEFVSSTLVDMYSKCGMATNALKVFERLRSPDIIAWTSIISCLDQQGHKREALNLFRSMRNTGLGPNQYTLSSLVSASSDLDPKICKSIHACVYKHGFECEKVVSNALISTYMKIGSFHHGFRVFDLMNDRDLISWNCLLSGFQDCDICDQGPKFFGQMLIEGFWPNMYTYISVLRLCSSLSSLSFGRQIHAHIIKENLDVDRFIGTALVDMYAKCNNLECAEIIFNRLDERDLFTWTVIISGYAQTDQGEKAIESFTQMRKEGINPNEFTLASCLRGCAGISSLDNGRLLHSQAIKSGLISDVFVGSSIVDMYGKCGCIKDAAISFESLDFRDTVAWNTIICSYAQHGMGYESLEAFKSMLDEGMLPDEVTFLGVLSACSHKGLVEEGKNYFDSMDGVYGIAPSVEHCACMVDIFGRAGKFNEVDTFIEDMKIESDALIWETVLGACKIHGNLEFGRRAAEKLFELEPERDSNYILLSNILAVQGKWLEVSKVRTLMSAHGVKKEPGCSWLSVDGKTHIFLSQDASHPKILEIYRKLEELGEVLDSVGYLPNIDGVLHDVCERERKENLHHHSERLALGLALISHSRSKTIRIFKNLRICGDCHSFMKLVSEITGREIIVRDIKRFHHFRFGACSCGDYW